MIFFKAEVIGLASALVITYNYSVVSSLGYHKVETILAEKCQVQRKMAGQ